MKKNHHGKQGNAIVARDFRSLWSLCVEQQRLVGFEATDALKPLGFYCSIYITVAVCLKHQLIKVETVNSRKTITGASVCVCVCVCLND